MNDRAMMLLVTAVGVWGAIGAFATAADPQDEGQGTNGLRVATYNVHQWHAGDDTGVHNLEAVRDVLRTVDPDLVALQETEGSRLSSGGLDGTGWLARALGMHHVQGPPSSEGSYGLAVLSRWPIQDVETLPLPADGTAPRHALLITVLHPDGDVRLLATHLEITRHAMVRDAQVDHLLSTVPDGPLLLLGDFNLPAVPEEPAYVRLAEAFDDAWLAAGHLPEDGPTSPLPGPEERIDHVWVRGYDVTGAGRFGGPAASDHHGVWADVVPAAT